MLPIETPRLLIRVPELEDVDQLMAVMGDSDAMQYIGDGTTRPRDEVAAGQEAKQRYLVEHGFTMFTVVEKSSGDVVGDCGLGTWKETGEIEIGWRFAPRFWGKGYGTEAAAAVFAHARKIGLIHLICMVQSKNVASWRIAERLGFALDREWVRNGRLTRRYVWQLPVPAA
jgi:[ribosomal protein S5]-alanine N-acetyltransferase